MFQLTLAKRNKIAPSSIFYLLFVSKAAELLTTGQQGQPWYLTKEFLPAMLIAVPLSVLLCVPVIMCVKYRKNPLKSKIISRIYSLYFLFIAGANGYRLYSFSGEVLGTKLTGMLFAVILTVCAGYCASLGIEAIARFSSFAFLIFMCGVLLLFLMNLGVADIINIYPLIFSKGSIFHNSLVIACSFSELAVILSLTQSVNGSMTKSYIAFDVSILIYAFVMLALAFAVLGDAFFYRNLPVFTLAQTATFGGIERLDAVFTAIFTFGIFLKSTIYIFCAAKCFAMKNNARAVVLSTLICTAFIFVVKYSETLADVTGIATVTLFAVFCLAIPTIALIFKKRNYGDELIEII